MRISIIVPAYNEERLLGETLRRIHAAREAFSRRNWWSELIVCDNNSSDRTATVAREAGAEVVFEPFNQIGRARNRGAAAAAGDWLIFIDADSHPSVGVFEDVADQIESGNCLAGGNVVQMDGDYPAFSLVRITTGFWNLASRSCRWMAGSFIFCEARAFRSIGGFDTALFVSEEIDLSKRLKKLARKEGRRVVVLHRHRIVTSSRKLRLYSVGEFLRFLARLIVRRRTLTDRDACYLWYDGRR